ncbi:hypothetical protein MLD38_030314 [Melastoma candidum]|nr:hypothetical protein MLD38_030314 [Melastoma candidum]
MSSEKQMQELQEARLRVAEVEEEYEDMEKAANALRSDLDALRDEKARALSSERVASSSIQGLLEEKARLVDELKISKEEEEKSKKAMESLASALHEVSAEARDAKEKLVCLQIEHENWEAKMEDLRLVLKATKDKYEAMLRDGKCEVDHLADAVERSSYEYEASKAEWEQKELHLMDCVKQSEQEKHDLQIAKEGLEILLKQAEEKADEAEGQEALLRESLKEVEDEVVYLQEALGEAKAEGMKLERCILDKERKSQGLARENEDLRVREATSLERIEELSKLLEEATFKTKPAENGDLLDSEREYDLLPKTVELSQENGHRGEDEKPEIDAVIQSKGPERDILLDMDGSMKEEHPRPDQGGSIKVGSRNGEAKEEDSVAEKEQEHYLGVESKATVEPEPEEDSKEECDDSFEKTNGTTTADHVEDGGNNSISEERNPKKKKALLRKFGSLLKKKGGSPSPKS